MLGKDNEWTYVFAHIKILREIKTVSNKDLFLEFL